MVDRHHMSSGQVAEWEDRIGVTHENGGGGQLKAFCQGCGIIVKKLFLFQNVSAGDTNQGQSILY